MRLTTLSRNLSTLVSNAGYFETTDTDPGALTPGLVATEGCGRSVESDVMYPFPCRRRSIGGISCVIFATHHDQMWVSGLVWCDIAVRTFHRLNFCNVFRR